MSEKSFSVASSPLTEMCTAICQPASTHFFFFKRSPGLHASAVCVRRIASHAGLEATRLEDRITLPLLGHLEISRFLFSRFSLHLNTNLCKAARLRIL